MKRNKMFGYRFSKKSCKFIEKRFKEMNQDELYKRLFESLKNYQYETCNGVKYIDTYNMDNMTRICSTNMIPDNLALFILLSVDGKMHENLKDYVSFITIDKHKVNKIGLTETDIKAFIYHELGHIDRLGTTNKLPVGDEEEILADKYAAEKLGKDIVINAFQKVLNKFSEALPTWHPDYERCYNLMQRRINILEEA